jgi:O-antigen/teichoic acid export membrane protein
MGSGALLAGMSVLTSIILSRYIILSIGAQLYGLWALVATVLAVANMCDQGLGDPISRIIAISFNSKNHKKVQEDFASGIILSVLVILPFIICLNFFSNFIVGFINVPVDMVSIANTLFSKMGLLLFVFVLAIVIDSVLAGIGRIDIPNMNKTGSRIFQILTTLLLLKLDYGVWAIYYGVLSFHFIRLCTGMIFIKKLTKIKLLNIYVSSFTNIKELYKMSYKLVLGRLVGIGNEPLLRIILAKYAGLESVAALDIGFKVIGLLTLLPIRAFRAIVPRASKASTNIKQGVIDMKNINSILSKYLIIIGIPTFIFIFFIGDSLLLFWLSNGYNKNMYVCLQLLLFPYFIHLFMMPKLNTLIGYGQTNQFAISAIIMTLSFFIGLLINYLTGFEYSFSGPIIAYAFGILMSSFYILYIYFVKLEYILIKQISNTSG